MAYIYRCELCGSETVIEPSLIGDDEQVCADCGSVGCQDCIPNGLCEDCSDRQAEEGEEGEEGK